MTIWSCYILVRHRFWYYLGGLPGVPAFCPRSAVFNAHTHKVAVYARSRTAADNISVQQDDFQQLQQPPSKKSSRRLGRLGAGARYAGEHCW